MTETSSMAFRGLIMNFACKLCNWGKKSSIPPETAERKRARERRNPKLLTDSTDPMKILHSPPYPHQVLT